MTGTEPSASTSKAADATGTRPKRTPEEPRLLDATARLWGRTLTEQEENLVIDEAYLIGDL